MTGYTAGIGRYVALAAAIGLLVVNSQVTASNDFWKSGVNGVWTDGAKWLDNTAPGNSDQATFTAGGTYTVTFDSEPPAIQALTLTNAPNVTFTSSSFIQPRTIRVTSASGSKDLLLTDVSTLSLGTSGVIFNPDKPLHLTVGDNLAVQNGSTLNVRFGSDVSTFRSNIASGGTVNVIGSGSVLMNDSDLTVGTTMSGFAAMTIQSGGAVSSNVGHVAEGGDSTGMATVFGVGSNWTNSGSIVIGEGGTGGLNVNTGGNVTSFSGTLGSLGGSTGTVNITDATSAWMMNDSLHVGENGAGALTISAGGNVSNTEGVIAKEPGSIGIVTVTGPGSTWTNRSLLFVGYYDKGSLVIENGATVSNSFGHVGWNRHSNSTGLPSTVLITGAGSKWINSYELWVGGYSKGEMTISGGGNVSSNYGAAIGLGADPSSEDPNALLIGNGTVNVTGTGSAWTNNGVFIVGMRGTGTLAIEDGGRVSSTSSFIGRYKDVTHPNEHLRYVSDGKVTVRGAGSSWTISGRLSMGGDATTGEDGGTGTLTLSSGGSVSVAQDTVLFPGSLLKLDGGSFATTTFAFQGGQFQWSAGTLHIDTFPGNLTAPAGGTLAPGRSAGSTMIAGGYTQQSGATLEIEIGGTALALHDFVNVSGTALLGGELLLELIDDFIPAAIDTFTVLNAPTGIAGVFSNVTTGQRLTTADGSGSFLVHYGATSAFNPNQIVLTAFEASPPLLPGDYNQNGVVDAGDYIVWRDNKSTNNVLPNDPIRGTVGQAQYDQWRAHFGQSSGGSRAATRLSSRTDTAAPEPTSIGLLLLAIGGLVLARRSGIGRWQADVKSATGIVIWCGVLPACVSAQAVTTNWNTNSSGSFTSPANWDNGVPDSEDTAVFNRGAATYSVTFPGGSVLNPPPSYLINRLIVRTSEVTFADNSSAFVTSPILTVFNPDSSIVIGDAAGEEAVLNTRLRGLYGAKTSIGRVPGSTGTLNVSAGSFSLSDELTIGEAGTGTMNVTAGSTVSNTLGVIGSIDDTGPDVKAGTGHVTVTGAGSTWINSSKLGLGAGAGASGTLTIEAGGRVSNTTGFVGASEGLFGLLGAGTGTVVVTGAGSTWSNSEILYVGVGVDTPGTLSILNGGTVTSAGGSIKSGVVTVSGSGSIWSNNGFLVIGNFGLGTLLVDAGGSVSNTGASINNNPDSTGTVTITGAGSTWNTADQLIVGSSGSGVLTVKDNGLTTVAGAGLVLLANAQGSKGTLRIGDGGAGGTIQATEVTSGFGTALVVFNHTESVHQFTPRLTGTVSVHHAGPGTTILAAATTYSGSTLVTAGKLIVQQGLSGGGNVTVVGGNLNVTGGLAAGGGTVRLENGVISADSISLAGGAFNFLGGTLHVDTFHGNLMNQGGKLAPGRSAGNTTIIGNYTQQAGASLEIEIGGTSAGGTYDLVGVTGTVVLGGELKLALIGSFLPASDHIFTVLNTANPFGVVGVFSNVTTGQRLATVDGLGSFLVHYGAGSAFNQNQIILTAFELAGDYNRNGIVDAADYVVWRRSVGQTGAGLAADGNFDQRIDVDDYNVWRSHFGQIAGSAAFAGAAVPEPSSAYLLCCTALGVLVTRRRHFRNELTARVTLSRRAR
jgi:T5SS/PEP-CTERM-associated repeat protein/autotransporter-associated beta strand protein